MQVTKKQLSDTKILLTISANEAYLAPIKERTLERLRGSVKLQGFREGKAPLNLVEKNVDPQVLQTEFVEEAMSQLYPEAATAEKLRPIDRPQITLKKFVPFTEIEFDAEVEVLGEVKLGDYKKIKKTKKVEKVADKDVQTIIDNLKLRLAEKKEVKRAAKDTDEVWIDFEGVNAKKEPIKGADGKDYPLVLGSDTFIPGFEKELLGAKAGESRTFTLTFPKDYRATSLAGSNVTFTANLKKVNEVVSPKEDDAFAKKVGPFKSLTELKADIKKELAVEKENKAQTELEKEIIEALADKSNVSVPDVLIADQVDRDLKELKQSLAQQGLTYEEFLSIENKTPELYEKEVVKPRAEQKVKTSLVLAEVSEAEALTVTPDELAGRIQQLKAQYNDERMQQELDKPEVHRDIAARMLTEKTINKLVDYATK
jgi:trigger factor